MKTHAKHILFLMIIATALAGCLNKTTTKKTTSSGSSNNSSNNNNGGSNNNNGGSNNSGGTTIPGCDGVYKEGATRCYYDNFPVVRISGPGTSGPTYWSSVSPLVGSSGGSLSQNQFVSDRYIAIRMIPERVLGNQAGSSTQVYSTTGLKCSPYMDGSNSLQVKVKLRTSSSSSGEIKTLTADYNQKSNVVYFNDLPGTNNPYQLEIVEVLSNNRCRQAGGSNSTYCPYSSIPHNTSASNYSECVGVKFQMATDTTYDFPN